MEPRHRGKIFSAGTQIPKLLLVTVDAPFIDLID